MPPHGGGSAIAAVVGVAQRDPWRLCGGGLGHGGGGGGHFLAANKRSWASVNFKKNSSARLGKHWRSLAVCQWIMTVSAMSSL